MGAMTARFTARARTLRTGQTDAERRLWSRLRNRQLLGFKFVRQEPVGPYVADFACREANVIVELDGSQHADSVQDVHRTAVLAQHGYKVIRFWNNEVLRNTDGVLRTIAETLETAPSATRFERTGVPPAGGATPS